MQNMFLRIGVDDNSIDGESTDMTGTNVLGEAGHVNWIEILSYSHELRQPTSPTVSSTGGRTVERCHHGDFTFYKYVDRATPEINQWCCMGHHIDKIVFELYRADASTSENTPVRYMYYILTHAIISSVTTHTMGDESVFAEGNKIRGDIPLEKVTFNYGLIYWKYDPQSRETGEGSEPIGTGWDLITNAPPDAEP